MDKSTRYHLSALDEFIKAEVETNKPKQPDEFTRIDYIEKYKSLGKNITLSTAKDQLSKLVDSKTISKRSITINGSKTNLYRFL